MALPPAVPAGRTLLVPFLLGPCGVKLSPPRQHHLSGGGCGGGGSRWQSRYFSLSLPCVVVAGSGGRSGRSLRAARARERERTGWGEPGGGARSPARAAGRGFPGADGEAALASRPSPSANENLLQCGGGGRAAGGRRRARSGGRGAGGTETERLAGHGAAPGCRTSAGALRGPL